jgi:hypothetical protein
MPRSPDNAKSAAGGLRRAGQLRLDGALESRWINDLARQPKCPSESAALDGERQTVAAAVQVGASTRLGLPRIHSRSAVDVPDDAEQVGFRCMATAPHARSYGLGHPASVPA